MKYNHAFSVCFSIESEDPEGRDLTAEQIRDAIMRRVRMAYENKELHEAIGAPYDTYEVEERK